MIHLLRKRATSDQIKEMLEEVEAVTRKILGGVQ